MKCEEHVKCIELGVLLCYLNKISKIIFYIVAIASTQPYTEIIIVEIL